MGFQHAATWRHSGDLRKRGHSQFCVSVETLILMEVWEPQSLTEPEMWTTASSWHGVGCDNCTKPGFIFWWTPCIWNHNGNSYFIQTHDASPPRHSSASVTWLMAVVLCRGDGTLNPGYSFWCVWNFPSNKVKNIKSQFKKMLLRLWFQGIMRALLKDVVDCQAKSSVSSKILQKS